MRKQTNFTPEDRLRVGNYRVFFDLEGSGDFIAHASYRVTGNAVGMGEAAGAVAAIAAKSKRLPHEVEWSEGAAMLQKIGQRA